VSPIDTVLAALERVGHPVRRGSGRCPAHDDSTPSLSVSEGSDGKVLIVCHRGCSLEAILSATGLDHADLFPPRAERTDNDEWTPNGPALARYRYTDAGGKLLFEVVRCEGKRFLQRRPDPTRKSGWDWKLGEIDRPLYRLPAVIEAVRDGLTVFVAEGEKDVDALVRVGAPATCNPHGAGKWLKSHSEALREADVVVIADKDDRGYSHARHVRDSLEGIASRLRIVEAVEGKDASDHLNAGHTIEEFVVIWPAANGREPGLAPDVHDFLAVADEYHWLIEGLLERGDRLLLTGFEGLGKSVMVAQLAAMSAAGLHPFRPSITFDPLRVLLVDRENSERQIRRKLRPLVQAAADTGHPIDRQRFFVLSRPDTLDLGREEDRAWLSERVRAHKPDILFIGPLYKLHQQNLNDEQASRVIADALDMIRAEAGCALVIEAHSGHGDDHDRNVRPIGSSLWRRWPEFGYGIRGTRETVRGTPVQFKAWRGPREERDWPTTLHHGSPWPWEGGWSSGATAPKPKATQPAQRREEEYDEQAMLDDREQPVF
jgi:hypothetical protein